MITALVPGGVCMSPRGDVYPQPIEAMHQLCDTHQPDRAVFHPCYRLGYTNVTPKRASRARWLGGAVARRRTQGGGGEMSCVRASLRRDGRPVTSVFENKIFLCRDEIGNANTIRTGRRLRTADCRH
ncbi:hypothetical protein J6590_037758 [Homalodisca vitripennis]|nr:hypothetical protein J6590_037758 [Homalodisca vitripennis]